MPRKLLAVFVVFLCLFVTLPCTAQGPLSGKIIVLDPGHGGTNDGAVANGVREADVNLAIAFKVRDKLAASGATVVMTRSCDQDVAVPGVPAAAELQARVDFISSADADIFVSLHANSHPNSETAGAITFYPSGRPTDLARAVQEAMVYEAGVIDKGVRPANFYVLRNSDVPAILVEVGFLTNRNEALRLTDKSYQDQLAAGIAKGILRYFLSR
jgi:N-acetylmuramoyl-L-alanine amidase